MPLTEKLEIPKEVSVSYLNNIILVKAGKSQCQRKFIDKKITLEVSNEITFKSQEDNKRARKIIGSYIAHLKNMFKGVLEGHHYIMKICSGHFPMTVAVQKGEFTVKNFLGEKVPRILKLKENVNVKVEGDQVKIDSADKELAGQTAGSIEKLTRRPGFDTRIFQDGIYIISKAGKVIK